MKTFDNFYDDMIALPNLYRAFELAKKGKKDKYEVIEFEKDLDSNLLSLHFALLTCSYESGGYKTFYINDYKKRKITAPSFRDQIVHYAIFIFLEQIYELNFIYDSYACRKNKGTHKAFKKLRKFVLRHNQEDYFMKGDVSKYFYSIDHYKLKEIISRKIKDKKALSLLGTIIDSHKEPEISAHINNLDYSEQKKGIPIGNLTSQLFANIYLNELDYFVKQKLKVKCYVRYMDDFILIEKDVKLLNVYFEKIKIYLSDYLCLKLERRKTQINKLSFGVDFVGFVCFKRYIKVRSRNYLRFIKKFDKNIWLYCKGRLEFEFLRNSFRSYEAHLLHTNSFTFLEKIRTRYHGVQIKKAVQRGGNWDDGADAGPFAVNLNNEPSNTNTNIGFRCCSAHEKYVLTSRSYDFSHVHEFAPSFSMKTGVKVPSWDFNDDGCTNNEIMRLLKNE